MQDGKKLVRLKELILKIIYNSLATQWAIQASIKSDRSLEKPEE